MDLRLSTLCICRSPIFSVDERLENVWEQLKEYIHESSPSFFEIIKGYNYADYEKASLKTKFTIWKYFNRAKFRPTPYGNFAAFSVIPLKPAASTNHIVVNKSPIIHRFTNWQEKETINYDPKWLTHNSSFFRANATIYACENDLRFINTFNSSFELSAIGNDPTANALLEFCKSKRSLADIQEFMQPLHLAEPMVNYLVEQLISFQLLLTDYQPNIIGSDYFKRIGHTSENHKNDYIIAERKRQYGYLSEKKLNVLVEITEFMNRNGLPNSSTALESFREKFKRRFEACEVPLSRAMDPELGIGYLSLIQDKNDDPLVQEINKSAQHFDNYLQINYSPLHQYILNQLVQQKPVHLENMISTKLPPAKAIANTISILLRPADDLLVVEQIGGCTANSLLGRFSIASETVHVMGQHYAKIEQQANPEVIFFDIAYQMENSADNVNRRRALYEYELPILCWTEKGELIDMDDIMVSVKGTEVVLRSVKYGKRLVPRLASAYNYTRSDLAVYRFLSDLQHQNLHSGLAIDIVQWFPGLSHYQRIQYKNVVLSPEKWKVPLQFLKGYESEQSSATLAEWFYSIGMKDCFRCGFADQTLLFNPSVENDRIAFLLFCKHKKEVYIEEAIFPVSALVKDEDQQPYVSELIVNLEHLSQIYQPCETALHKEESNDKVFLPGDNWLYFEIYCHKSRSNSLLQEIYLRALPALKSKLKTWFFIRYNDPTEHIRFRLQLKHNADAALVMKSFNDLLKPYIEAGTVSDLQLKTYRRETERYGAQRMEMIEKYFNLSSQLALLLIRKHKTVNELYAVTIMMVQRIWEMAELDAADQLLFTDKMSDYFAAEKSTGPEGFKKINQHFKAFNTETSDLHINKIIQKKTDMVIKYFLRVIHSCSIAEREKMTSDLIHMHINRLFSTDQRTHEFVFYYYLGRKLKTIMNMTKKGRSVII